MADSTKLGFSGRIAQRFLTTEITPLLALVGLLLGLFAILVTPREEEPQIDVTFANVFIPFPGATASEIEHLVTTPAEQVLSEIEGIEHVYSTSSPGMATLTVQYRVGEDQTQAIVRLYNKIFSNQDWLPANLGVGQPIIKPKGIDDVPIVTITLWSKDTSVGAHELGLVAHAIEAELKRVPGTRDIYSIGDPDRAVRVLLDPQALAGYGIDLDQLRQALRASNVVRDDIALTAANRELRIQAGTFLKTAEEIGELVVAVRNGKPVFLADVANIELAPETPDQYVWMGLPRSGEAEGATAPAVTVAVAKKPGTNAVKIAEQVVDRLHSLEGIFIPDNIEYTVTRDYGITADAKAKKLIQKLTFATLSVIALVLLAIGWRESIIVGAAVVVTLAITLFASWAWGFTLNRVSLFALIFSIGILVDDAIVVVENIHRHLQSGAARLTEAIPRAVDEVGGPTILATFTVIAALLPMAFVTGLMGPYMSPIPINASLGMMISLAVAFVFTPWMTRRLLSHQAHPQPEPAPEEEDERSAWHRVFQALLEPFLLGERAGRRRWLLFAGVLLLLGASVSLVYFRAVVLKMLPFDNKSELQVVLDMPEGTSLERTAKVLGEMARRLETLPELADYQVYAGTASPIGFNGLVRQYYLREGAHLGDIQVNLVAAGERERTSHDIARAIRDPLQTIAERHGGNAKIVEVPPGPPVMSPLVGEIYGLDYVGQIEVAKRVRHIVESTPGIVDIDDSVEFPAEQLIVRVDRQKASLLGVPQDAIAEGLGTILRGENVTHLHGANVKYAIPIRLEYPVAEKADLEAVLSLEFRSRDGRMVPLSELVELVDSRREHSVHHKDLLPVVYVTGDMAGALDSPLYGLVDIAGQLRELGEPIQYFVEAPETPYDYSVKWDGEWQVTYETFRDMGLAYSVGLVLIYLLVVAQFRSYLIPLVIMAPIPLTIIGILPGHALLDKQFTATSMVGMIALAGIIVRNSILLVDFINAEVARGIDLSTAVVRSGAVRAKPIILTGAAAMAGAFFILDDPIFSGLAVALIFGLLVSTALTLIVIPVLYYAATHKRLAKRS